MRESLFSGFNQLHGKCQFPDSENVAKIRSMVRLEDEARLRPRLRRGRSPMSGSSLKCLPNYET